MPAGDRVASPWHEVQLAAPEATSTTPFMCFPPATSIVPSAFTVAGWQPAHAVTPPVTAGCPLEVGGGAPWQLPHCRCVPSTAVQIGWVFAPPGSVAPWQ